MSCLICGTENAQSFRWGYEIGKEDGVEMCEPCLPPAVQAFLSEERARTARVRNAREAFLAAQLLEVEMSWPKRRAKLEAVRKLVIEDVASK